MWTSLWLNMADYHNCLTALEEVSDIKLKNLLHHLGVDTVTDRQLCLACNMFFYFIKDAKKATYIQVTSAQRFICSWIPSRHSFSSALSLLLRYYQFISLKLVLLNYLWASMNFNPLLLIFFHLMLRFVIYLFWEWIPFLGTYIP